MDPGDHFSLIPTFVLWLPLGEGALVPSRTGLSVILELPALLRFWREPQDGTGWDCI